MSGREKRPGGGNSKAAINRLLVERLLVLQKKTESVLEVGDNPLSLSDSFYFEIGDTRDICVCVDVDQFFEGKESISIQAEPSHIEPQNMPHKPRPSFYKWVSIISLSDSIHLRVSEKALYGAYQ